MVATAPNRPLAWEPPHAAGSSPRTGIKTKKKKNKNKKHKHKIIKSKRTVKETTDTYVGR